MTGVVHSADEALSVMWIDLDVFMGSAGGIRHHKRKQTLWNRSVVALDKLSCWLKGVKLQLVSQASLTSDFSAT